MNLASGLERARRSRLAVPLAISAAAALLVVGEFGFRLTDATMRHREQVLNNRAEVGRLLRLVISAESSHRGYLLTGRLAYQQPYSEMLPQLDSQVRKVETLYADEPQMAAQVHALVELVRRKATEMQTTARLFEEGKEEAWREVMLTDIGRETMVDIERLAGDINAEETRRLNSAGRLVEETLWFSRLAIDAMVLLSLGVLVALIVKARRLAAERALRLHEVSSERDRLENEVERRTADITEIARHLQSAREDERGRLARELHDELGGLLTAAKLDVARMRNRLATAPPEVGERLVHLVQTLDAGISLKRRIIEDLHPSSLSNLGLKAALEILCAEFAESSQLTVSTSVDEVKLDKAAQLTVYRLVQEALTNTAKYAKASSVDVSLEADDGCVTVSVQDDGVGFDTENRPSASHGLAGMRFRVHSARGELNVKSAPGAGTTISARLPL